MTVAIVVYKGLIPVVGRILTEIAGSSLRGMGKSLTPAVLTVFGTCLLRIVWVYGVSPVWRGYDVLMMVYPVLWVVTGLLVLTVYWLFIRKKRLALN